VEIAIKMKICILVNKTVGKRGKNPSLDEEERFYVCRKIKYRERKNKKAKINKSKKFAY